MAEKKNGSKDGVIIGESGQALANVDVRRMSTAQLVSVLEPRFKKKFEDQLRLAVEAARTGASIGSAGFTSQMEGGLITEDVEIEELGGSAEIWEPENVGDSILFQVRSYEEGVGKFKTDLISGTTPFGPVKIWARASIALSIGRYVNKDTGVVHDNRKPLGSMFMIVYRGEIDVDKGNPMKDFAVLSIKRKVPLAPPAELPVLPAAEAEEEAPAF